MKKFIFFLIEHLLSVNHIIRMQVLKGENDLCSIEPCSNKNKVKNFIEIDSL